jgi:hypothetical protein
MIAWFVVVWSYASGVVCGGIEHDDGSCVFMGPESLEWRSSAREALAQARACGWVLSKFETFELAVEWCVKNAHLLEAKQ